MDCRWGIFLVTGVLCLQPAFAKTNSIAGLWETEFGRLRLVETSEKTNGVYQFAGGSTIQGLVTNKVLKFNYEEGVTKGEGEFVFAPDGQSFTGKWRELHTQPWSPWNGRRISPQAGVSRLIVLEGKWETEDAGYSFATMLKAFFARNPMMKVDKFRITDRANLISRLRATAYIAEPFVVVIASHGSSDGVLTENGPVSGTEISHALRYSTTAKLLHFSACDVMKGTFSSAIPVSGYSTSVDWAASAIAEFMYFDLILNRDLKPKSAAKLLEKLMPFTADIIIEDSPFESLGFKFAD